MADLNKPLVTPDARKPRGAVKLNGNIIERVSNKGQLIEPWVSLEVNNNSFRAADTFRVVFAASALPSAYDVAWMSAQNDVAVEIFAGLAIGESLDALDSLIYGRTDHIEYDPVAGTVTLSGRDLTSLLIDTRTSKNYQEKTSSQIATELAQSHGLIPVVTPTTTIVGAYYKSDHVSLTQEQSEWELLSYLANVEDFDLFVKGQELHFTKRVPETGNHYVIEWQPPGENAFPQSNAIGLMFARDLSISKGITVEVRSWNADYKRGFVVSWPKTAKAVKPGQFAAKTQIYKYRVGGLQRDAALQLAQNRYDQLVKHEVKLTGYLPADNILDCTKTILVRGTGTAFDQVYYPEDIQRILSVNEGYRMNITAKNVTPETERVA